VGHEPGDRWAEPAAPSGWRGCARGNRSSQEVPRVSALRGGRLPRSWLSTKRLGNATPERALKLTAALAGGFRPVESEPGLLCWRGKGDGFFFFSHHLPPAELRQEGGPVLGRSGEVCFWFRRKSLQVCLVLLESWP